VVARALRASGSDGVSRTASFAATIEFVASAYRLNSLEKPNRADMTIITMSRAIVRTETISCKGFSDEFWRDVRATLLKI
jgi:hypothetical protein